MTQFTPASRIAALEVSEILAITARANAMRREGLPVIILGAGEPDFDTPDPINAAAKAAIDRGETKYTALNAIPGITCRRPEGAFYTYAECGGLLGKRTPEGRILETDRDFCAWLLDTAHVAVVPGAAFGASPCFRISYATSDAQLTEAMSRLTRACETLT